MMNLNGFPAVGDSETVNMYVLTTIVRKTS